MIETFINEIIPKALGTAYTNPITGQLPANIEIGQIHNFSENLHVINKIIEEFNTQNQVDFDAMTEEKQNELGINCALKILSYEQYLHFLKLAKTTSKEIRSLYRQQALTIAPYSVDTKSLQQYKDLERSFELAKDTSTPNGIKEAAKLVRIGMNPKDPQSLSNIRASIKNIERDQKDLDTLINQKKVILFNLSKGDIGADVSEALGRFIIALLQGIAMRRQKQAKEQRTPVHLFIDECQNYIGTSTITILEEARKYGVYLTLAQQVAGRGMSPEVRAVTFNNTNIKIMGRTPDDKRMAGIIGIETEDAQQLATGEFYCKAGNKPPFKFQAHTYLVKDMEASEGYYMNNEEFNIVKQNQVKQFYAPIKKEGKTTSKRELI